MNKEHEADIVCGAPGAAEMEKINQYTRRTLSKEEVFTFSAILCDNEVDRDGERFSEEAIEKLAALYPGKSGLFDHSGKSSDQCARVFDTRVETVAGRLTKAGTPYCRLRAYIYMLRGGKNAELIREIDAGIKKEVSVGCAVGGVQCSVCGAARGGCTHKAGAAYGGKVCHFVLSEPTDAYEWSFVAVPAQPEAGVTKRFYESKKGEVDGMEDVLSVLKSHREGVTLDGQQAGRLIEEMERLDALAEDGRIYHSQLEKEVVRLCAAAVPEMDLMRFREVCKRLDTMELGAFRRAFLGKAEEGAALTPQLAPAAQAQAVDHAEFKI